MGLVALAQVARFGHAIGHGLEHAGIGVELGFLRHVNDSHRLFTLQQPVVEPFNACQDFQQAAFAGAVAANQTDTFAGFKGEVCAV